MLEVVRREYNVRKSEIGNNDELSKNKDGVIKNNEVSSTSVQLQKDQTHANTELLLRSSRTDGEI